MSTTNHPQEESTGALLAAEPRWGSRLRRRRMLVAAVAGIAGLALAIAGWSAVSASAESESPPPGGNEGDTTYEQCVTAALDALGPPEEAFNEGSGSDADALGDNQTTPEKPSGSGTSPEVQDIEEPHPNSPAHEWCTADCPEDEQCARPQEFTVVRDEDVETISFENPEPEGDPAG